MAAASSGRTMEAWSEGEVSAWLTVKDFKGVVIQHFKDEKVNGKVLSTLTDKDLKQLGVTSSLHQKKVVTAIKKEHAKLEDAAGGVKTWSEEQVGKWLESRNFAGLEISRFKEEGIDGATLAVLDEDALQTLGIGTSLHRKVVRAAIDQLLDPEVAAATQQDPELARRLVEAGEEVARLAALHAADGDVTAAAKQDAAAAKAAAAAVVAEMEALKAKQAATEHASRFGKALLKPEAISFTEPDRKLGDGGSADVFHGTITMGKQTRAAALKVFRGSFGVPLSKAMLRKIVNEVEVRKS